MTRRSTYRVLTKEQKCQLGIAFQEDRHLTTNRSKLLCSQIGIDYGQLKNAFKDMAQSKRRIITENDEDEKKLKFHTESGDGSLPKAITGDWQSTTASSSNGNGPTIFEWINIRPSPQEEEKIVHSLKLEASKSAVELALTSFSGEDRREIIKVLARHLTSDDLEVLEREMVGETPSPFSLSSPFYSDTDSNSFDDTSIYFNE